jgi:N-acetylglutamate synthase-like GNAT family acetyltransferase
MDSQHLQVRRARPSDAEQIAEFVNKALERDGLVDRHAVVARLGDVGLLLAEEDRTLRGLLGWRVENLVACVVDLIISPAQDRQRVGRRLFEEMEEAAADLHAEAAILFLPPAYPDELASFLEDLGYAPRSVATLRSAWREMASEAGRDDSDEIPVKELSSDEVSSPL